LTPPTFWPPGHGARPSGHVGVVGMFWHTPFTHRCVASGQQVPPHGVVPVGHSHLQVLLLKTFPPLQMVAWTLTHCGPTVLPATVPPPGQQRSPGSQQAAVTPPLPPVPGTPGHGVAQAQWPSMQKCVQHSAFDLQRSSAPRHLWLWLAAASGARTAESTPAAAAAAATLKNLRREVLVASALLSWSNPSALIAVPPWYIASGGKSPCFGLWLTSTPSPFLSPPTVPSTIQKPATHIR
jgi:hypothetical protein